MSCLCECYESQTKKYSEFVENDGTYLTGKEPDIDLQRDDLQ